MLYECCNRYGIVTTVYRIDLNSGKHHLESFTS